MIAVHALLLVWLGSSGGWRMQRDARAVPQVVTLRLLPWTKPALTQPAPLAEPVKRAPAAPAEFVPIAAPKGPRVEREMSPALAITGGNAAETADAPASQASQPPPLNLTLPPNFDRRATLRNPALDDSRANTTRTTPEQRMAKTFDTRVIEEDLGDGRRRIRRGDDCVIVKASRIGQLMPFNEAAARSPSLVGACP